MQEKKFIRAKAREPEVKLRVKAGPDLHAHAAPDKGQIGQIGW